MASTEALAPGSVFAGRFRIVELLGEGEMGAAYLVGVLPEKKKVCVLKAMTAALVKQDALRRLFDGYAKSTSKVASTNVLQTLDAGIDRATGRPWFTTDLLRGEDLAARVAREGAQPLPDVRLLLAALGDALGKAHAQGLIHYDLTPENIHLGRGRPIAVKLRELTISRLVSDAVAAEGEVVGTAIWMPPEQFDLGRRLTPAANVWSLALLAFYAATGRPYWMSASDDPSPSKDLLREILRSPIVSASERAKALGCTGGLPPWFDGWFARCVTREPGKRVPNAHAAHALLAESLDRHYALADDDDDDDQRTTLRLPDPPTQPKRSRSFPRGILAEAMGGPTVSATPPPPGAARVDHRGAKERGRRRWPYLTLLSAAAVLLLWFQLLSDRNQSTSSPGNAAASDSAEKTLRSPPPSARSSGSVAAEVASTAAALGSATSDARAPGGAVAVRAFAAGDGQGGTDDFELAVALKALNGVYYGNCAVPSGGKLAITFAPSGRVKTVAVLRGDYDEATTGCIAARFGAARMSPFRGGEQSVTADIVATR